MPYRNKRIAAYFFKTYRAPLKPRKLVSCNKYVAENSHVSGVKLRGYFAGRGHEGYVENSVFQFFHRAVARTGVYLYFYARVLHAEFVHYVVQKAVQRGDGGAYVHGAAFGIYRLHYFLFAFVELILRNSDVLEQRFALFGKFYAVFVAHKQFAPQLAFHALYHARHGRLAGMQFRCRLGYVFVFTHVVKYFVVFVVHCTAPYMCFCYV